MASPTKAARATTTGTQTACAERQRLPLRRACARSRSSTRRARQAATAWTTTAMAPQTTGCWRRRAQTRPVFVLGRSRPVVRAVLFGYFFHGPLALANSQPENRRHHRRRPCWREIHSISPRLIALNFFAIERRTHGNALRPVRWRPSEGKPDRRSTRVGGAI